MFWLKELYMNYFSVSSFASVGLVDGGGGGFGVGGGGGGGGGGVGRFLGAGDKFVSVARKR